MTDTDGTDGAELAPVLTTRQKIVALVGYVQQLPPDDAAPDTRDLVEMAQIASGFGVDLVATLVPDSDAETDVLIDKLIALLLQLRGDDLPPFDLARYGEMLDEPAPAP